MLIKSIQDEDFVNYHKASMFIGNCYCDWKCCLEGHLPLETCQNHQIMAQPNIDCSDEIIYQRYIANPITTSIVIGGLEPFLQFEEMVSLIRYFRENGCNDDFVIYTGYYPNEIEDQIEELKQYKNIVIKFGRYIPNHQNHYDEVLGVSLVSNNQYGEKIS